MSNLMIKYASKDVVCFSVDDQVYYLKFGPNVPQLFDEHLVLMIIPNIDTWIQSKTQQRHSYQSLYDMSLCFYNGIQTSYNIANIDQICNLVIKLTIDEILKNGWIYEYSLIYWIEVLGPDTIEECLKKISLNFEIIRDKIGDHKLYNNLCRISKTCRVRQPHNSDICDKLIERLNMGSSDPVYPNTDSLDNKVSAGVKELLKKSIGIFYKGIPSNIIDNIRLLQFR